MSSEEPTAIDSNTESTPTATANRVYASEENGTTDHVGEFDKPAPKKTFKSKKKMVKATKSNAGSNSEAAGLIENDGNVLVGRATETVGGEETSTDSPEKVQANPPPSTSAPREKTKLEVEHPKTDAYIRSQLEIAKNTKEMLDKYEFEVFEYTSGNRNDKSNDQTDAFIQHLEREGTKESARTVAEWLALGKVKLEDGVLSTDNPINLHLVETDDKAIKGDNNEPLSSISSASKVHELLAGVPAVKAKLDCDDVCHLLRMFDGCVAPLILDFLFIPVLLHDGASYDERMRRAASGSLIVDGDASPDLVKKSIAKKYSLAAKVKVGGKEVWKNPIYSARMLPGEVRTYAGRAVHVLRAPLAWNGMKVGAGDIFGCGVFFKHGLKSLVPQSYRERLVGGGDLAQVFLPFHERRQVNVAYGILNIHQDVGCFQSLVHNRNYEVFDNPGCHAIIRHILGEVSSLIYINMFSNGIIVILWIQYSRDMRGSGGERSWFYARLLVFAYLYRACQIILQLVGANTFKMLRDVVEQPFFWWQVSQTVASIACLFTLWETGTELGNIARTVVSIIIGAQWWNALYSLRIIKTLGECIVPIVAAMIRINVLSFLLITFFYCGGMAHSLYTLGLHEFIDAALITYRLAVLGDFDLSEIDGTGTGLKAVSGSNATLASLDMEMYDIRATKDDDRGSTLADRHFARFFVGVVGITSTVLLMNVLIGVISINFEMEYENRSRTYWKTAGKIAFQFSQQWEGLRQILQRISFQYWRVQPVIYKVTYEKSMRKRSSVTSGEGSVGCDDADEFDHLWYCTPASRIESDDSEMEVLKKTMEAVTEENRRLDAKLEEQQKLLDEQMRLLNRLASK